MTAPWQPPQPKPKLPLFLGMVFGATAPFCGIGLSSLLSSIGSAAASQVAPLASVVVVLATLATGVGLLFSDETRRWGAGILLGFFGMLIIGAGACVAVLVVVLSAYNGG